MELFKKFLLIIFNFLIIFPIFSDDSITVSEFAYGLSFDGSNFWYIDTRSRSLIKIDENKNQSYYNLNVPFMTGIDFDFMEGRLFIGARNLILRVEPNTGEIIDRIRVPIKEIGGLASYKGLIYILNSEDGKVSIFDKATESIIGGFFSDRSLAKDISFTRNNIWISDSDDGNIYRYNPDSGNITGFIKTPAKEIRGFEFIGGKFWIIDRKSKTIIQTSFIETDRFIASGEKDYKVKVKLEINLDAPSIFKTKVGVLLPPTDEHQRIRNIHFDDNKFLKGSVYTNRAFVKELAVNDSKNFSITYSFLAKIQHLRYNISDDYLTKKEPIPSYLEEFILKKENIQKFKKDYFLEKIFEFRNSTNNLKDFKMKLLETGVPVNPVYSIHSQDNSKKIIETINIFIPSYGWVSIENLKLKENEDLRNFEKPATILDLYKSFNFESLQSPVFFQNRNSNDWQNLKSVVSVIFEEEKFNE